MKKQWGRQRGRGRQGHHLEEVAPQEISILSGVYKGNSTGEFPSSFFSYLFFCVFRGGLRRAIVFPMFSVASHSFSFIFCGFPFFLPRRTKRVPKRTEKGPKMEHVCSQNGHRKGYRFWIQFRTVFGAQRVPKRVPKWTPWGVISVSLFGCFLGEEKVNIKVAKGLRGDFGGTSRGALSWPWAPGGGLMVKDPSE